MKVHNQASVIAVNAIVAIMEMDRNMIISNDVEIMINYVNKHHITIGKISRIDSGVGEKCESTVTVRSEFSENRGNMVYIQAFYFEDGEARQVDPEVGYHFDDLVEAARSVARYMSVEWWDTKVVPF